MSRVIRYTPHETTFVKALICEISFRETCALMARSPLVIDPVFLPKGLHDIGQANMLARLQEQVDAVNPEHYSHTLLVYGLCNNGIVGLRATRTPLVVPRAHDCITFFLGSKERYQEYFDSHPGTYFMTTGWSERNIVDPEQELPSQVQCVVGDSVMRQLGLDGTFEEYVQKYGEENAKYITEMAGNWLKNYCRCTYIRMGITNEAPYEEAARQSASDRGWQFEQVDGSMRLLQKFLFGEWDDSEFLVVPVGHRIVARYDGSIIGSSPDGQAQHGAA